MHAHETRRLLGRVTPMQQAVTTVMTHRQVMARIFSQKGTAQWQNTLL